MRSHRPALLLLALSAAGCGGESPVLPDTSKRIPVLASLYQHRDLESWRALPASAPAEERAAAAYALAALETRPLESLEPLLRLVADDDPSVRLAAVVAMGRLGMPSGRAVERLVALFDAPEDALRRHARYAAVQCGAAGLPALASALQSSVLRVRYGALVVLTGLGLAAGDLSEEVLALAETDEDAELRRTALQTLTRLGPRGLEPLVGMLEAPGIVRRDSAVMALRSAGPAALPVLVALLQHPSQEVAAVAAGILADLGPAAAPALAPLLRALDRAGPVSFNAAQALVAIGAQAVPALEALTSSSDDALADVARYALDEIRSAPPR